MKLLIVNQHTSNRGDEAAGKSLLKALEEKKVNDISVFYNANCMVDEEKFNISTIKKHYFYPRKLDLVSKFVMLATFYLPISITKYLFFLSKPIYYNYKVIKEHDYVLNAPGGVNIGPYMDWWYLWRLYLALKLKKKVGIYSISFGPIPENKIFKKISLYVLRNVSFLSLRDKKSQMFAKELDIKYIKSIDTVFINKLEKKIPYEFLEKLKNNKFVVIVPNQLYKWHPLFKNISPESMDSVYINIAKLIIKNGFSVVLLPQLYGCQNDYEYLTKLKNKISKENVFVFSDKYPVEYHIGLIDKAEFLIGARYHSIIFSILTETPFISLSYEHKMEDTLTILGLEKYNLSILDILNRNDYEEEVLRMMKKIDKEKLRYAKKKAEELARNTFENLISKFFRIENA